MDTNITTRYSLAEMQRMQRMQAQGYEFTEVTQPGDLTRSWAVVAFDARAAQRPDTPRVPPTLGVNLNAWRAQP